MQSDSVFDLDSKFEDLKSKKKKSNKINKEKVSSLLNDKYQQKMTRVESKEFIAETGSIPKDRENALDLPNSLARTENTTYGDKKSLVMSENALDLPNSLARTENTADKNIKSLSENALDLPNSLTRTENTAEKDKKSIVVSDTKSKLSGITSTTNRTRNIKNNKSDLFSVTIKSLSNSGQLYQVNASGADINQITDIVTKG